MYSVLRGALRQWNKSNDRHAKLQYIYSVTAVGLLVLAGLIGLINYNLGQIIVKIAAALLGIAVINAVAWALADAFIISRIATRASKRS